MENSLSEFAVVIPAFNESTVLPDLLGNLLSMGVRIICIDDGSTDSTSNYVRAFKEAVLLQHLVNRGQGAALETGFEFLRRNPQNTRYVITFDADGQHDVKDIYAFAKVARTEKFDLILGNRFGDRQSNVPVLKTLLLKLSALSIRVFLRLDLKDRHNRFRCISMSSLSQFRLKCDSYEHADEILFLSKRMNF